MDMAGDSNGRATIIAASLISFAVIAASFFVANSLDRVTTQLSEVVEALDAGPGAAGQAAADRPSRPARPEADREYKIDIGDAPIRGSENAAVTIVEWSDFQCPFCNRVEPTLAQIEKEYGDQVRVVFKHLPLPMHPQAPDAHAAAEAAHRQGKFWEMHDLIFQNQRDLRVETLEGYARQLGLDMDRYRRDVKSEEVANRIDADMKQAGSVGVSGTPAFFINGRFLSGAQPYANFKRYIDSALQKAS
jgi:protein-disulfide isomerase